MLDTELITKALGYEFCRCAYLDLIKYGFDADFAKWVLDFLASREVAFKKAGIKQSKELNKEYALNKILINLNRGAGDKTFSMPLLDRLMLMFESDASFNINKSDGKCSITIQKHSLLNEKLKCKLNKQVYPYQSKRYTKIMRHELSHCVNTDIVEIKANEQLGEIMALLKTSDNYSFDYDCAKYLYFNEKPNYQAISGFSFLDLSEPILGYQLKEFEEGMVELEQNIVDIVFGLEGGTTPAYYPNEVLAEHIGNVVGLTKLFRARAKHQFGTLCDDYKKVTGKSIEPLIKELNKICKCRAYDIKEFRYKSEIFEEKLARQYAELKKSNQDQAIE